MFYNPQIAGLIRTRFVWSQDYTNVPGILAWHSRWKWLIDDLPIKSIRILSTTGGFLKWGTPSYHPFLVIFSINQPSIWDTPMTKRNPKTSISHILTIFFEQILTIIIPMETIPGNRQWSYSIATWVFFVKSPEARIPRHPKAPPGPRCLQRVRGTRRGGACLHLKSYSGK